MSYINAISTYLNSNSNILQNGRVLVGQSHCKDINIKGKYALLQCDTRVIKDQILQSLYNSIEDLRCIADYVIISEDIALVCEMKSNNQGKLKKQLINTGYFIKYLLEIVKYHSKLKTPIPTIKYVYFAKENEKLKQSIKVNKLESISFGKAELFQLPCNSEYNLKQFI